MQLTSEQRETLSSLIAGELEMAKGMLVLLESEHATLTEGNPDTIQSASHKKLEHMQLMEQNISSRNQFLLNLGLTADEQGIEQAVAVAGQNSKLDSDWNELKDTAKKLQKQNEINGGIIALGQRQVKQALDILSGKENLTGTYSQQGETQFSKSNNLHTKA
jgi:flagellar biosynthesis/type III secretory pathway chaperone